MTKHLLIIAALLLSFITEAGFAENNATASPSLSGRLFNLSYIGNALTISTTTPAWFYQFAGIKAITAGFSLLNCTSSDNGFCLFSASDTSAANLTLRGPATQPQLKLCLNGLGNTYSCESFNMASMGDRFAYVANATGGGSVSLCPINSTSGAFGACVNAGATGLQNGSRFIAINNTGTIAYVTNADNDIVSRCPINTDGALGACSNTNAGNTFDGPGGIALSNAGSIAYVVNSGNDTVSRCPINSDGSFGSCIDLNGNGTFQLPVGIALNNAGTFAYVANQFTVSLCPINTDGSFGTCSTSTGNFLGPYGIALNNAGSIVYVTNFAGAGDTVSFCPVNADGSFGTCSNSNGNNTFQRPVAIALDSGGTFAYVTNDDSNNISKCSINVNGSLGDCSILGNAFDNPFGIALF